MNVRARLRSLVEKLRSQQAYLLIFGPLKSGKSTLMNAISGAYVSEVTSLPGYPCLVYVRHGEEPHFSVTRYNGRESVFANGSVLKDVIADSHVALAQQIRATEDARRRVRSAHPFHRGDPPHRCEAAGAKASANPSTVLVDTPGLYSRMNFGYDVLTREFRDSAACAVFVVKTDNLFLEQVFAEFNQLLGLFSRIFLVDQCGLEQARPAAPMARLRPSAESANPEQIIEAFKTLSMAGPLRQAYEENRVRIHAVDLLSAASRLTSPEASHGNGTAPSGEHPQKQGVRRLPHDLTDYLNSSDYTEEFIRDSLRQGSTLCTEAATILESNALQHVREKQEDLAAQMADLEERSAAVERLLKVDWDATFKPARSDAAKATVNAANAKSAQVTKELRTGFDRWVEGAESLKALEEKYWNPRIIEAARALAGDTRGRLRGILENHLGGAEPAATVMSDLHLLGFSLVPSAQAALVELNAEEELNAYRLTINGEEIPVNKTFLDWILFRKMATVQHRLFGEDLGQEIAPEVKQQRLGDGSREALARMIDEVVKKKVAVLPGQFADRLLNAYAAKFREDVMDRLQGQREQLAAEREARRTPFEANGQVITALEALRTCATEVEAALRRISEEENAALPVGSPTPEPEPELAPAPAQPSNPGLQGNADLPLAAAS